MHPNHKRASDYSKAIVDSWRLTLWYFELVLLWQFGYSGKYCNRVTYQVEVVPWTA